LLVRGTDAPPEIFWYSDFAPCTRVLPELPIADCTLSAWNDFAAFEADDGNTVCHFRPRRPGAAEWDRAEALARQAAPTAEWAAFDEGVWVAYTSPNPIRGFQCGREQDSTSAFSQADSGTLFGQAACVGQCDSAIAIEPVKTDAGYAATVFVAFGKHYAQTGEILRFATGEGYDALLERTLEHWSRWLGTAHLPATDDADVVNACKRDLLTIAQCLDGNSHAIAASPSAPLGALDWPRHGIWTTLALDLAGYHDLAEAHALFYCGAIRTEGRRGKPYGSMPAALYGNGIEGVPHVILDAEAVAWTLATCWRHVGFLDTPHRRGFLAQIHDAATRASDFLVDWADSRTREPLPSFDPRHGRDVQSEEQLLVQHLGISSALAILTGLGELTPEDLSRRKRDLEALIIFSCVDKNGVWKSDAIPPLGRAAMDSTELPSWDAVIERRLAAAASDPVTALCDAALAWERKPDKLASLRPLLGEVSRGDRPGVDAVAAARHFIAAATIYAPSR
jgi:hypothetical protein